jgi:hypothetical protein
VGNSKQVAERSPERIERHESKADLVAHHDDRTIVAFDRGQDVGERTVENTIDPGGIVGKREARPQCQAIQKDRRPRRHVADHASQVFARLDSDPLGWPIETMASNPVVKLWIAGQGRRDVDDGTARRQVSRTVPPEAALPASRATEDDDERPAHGWCVTAATPRRVAASVTSTTAPSPSPSS